MAAAKNINGYLVSKAKDGQWWISNAKGEQVVGPLPTEAMAVEVASVFEDTPPGPKRRGDDQD
ncbi:hypothetical protein [Pseudomonas sp. NPDC089534]|uniref:hypothetical protein n=1 Tax=Pseudomonas sp. NPDC089534 TaxID=3364468 RepID=UPI00380ED1E2